MDQFVYHIAHDIRASLRALRVIPDWIAEDINEKYGEISPETAQHIKILTTQAGRLDQMMQDLLIYSRAGREQTIKEVNLERMIEYQFSLISVPSGHSFECDLEAGILKVNEDDIGTLIGILLSNAFRHGGPQVKISSVQSEDEIHLSVWDNGPGIPPKYHEKIFQVMTTLQSRDDVEGSGLGLATAQKLMRKQGGFITIESEGDGTGTTFTAIFPNQTK